MCFPEWKKKRRNTQQRNSARSLCWWPRYFSCDVPNAPEGSSNLTAPTVPTTDGRHLCSQQSHSSELPPCGNLPCWVDALSLIGGPGAKHRPAGSRCSPGSLQDAASRGCQPQSACSSRPRCRTKQHNTRFWRAGGAHPQHGAGEPGSAAQESGSGTSCRGGHRVAKQLFESISKLRFHLDI